MRIEVGPPFAVMPLCVACSRCSESRFKHKIQETVGVRIGADVVAGNPGLFFQMFKHPLKNMGLAQFTNNWERVPR